MQVRNLIRRPGELPAGNIRVDRANQRFGNFVATHKRTKFAGLLTVPTLEEVIRLWWAATRANPEVLTNISLLRGATLWCWCCDTDTNLNIIKGHDCHARYLSRLANAPDLKTEISAIDAELTERKAVIIAGTGSRELQRADLTTKRIIVERISEALPDDCTVMSGMAEGFDKAVAMTALNRELPLECVIPNEGYSRYYWGAHSLTGENRLSEFDSIVGRASKKTYVMEDIFPGVEIDYAYRVMTSSLPQEYQDLLRAKRVHTNFVRNAYMVLHADKFIVWDSNTPGTRQCVAMLDSIGKEYIILNETQDDIS